MGGGKRGEGWTALGCSGWGEGEGRAGVVTRVRAGWSGGLGWVLFCGGLNVWVVEGVGTRSRRIWARPRAARSVRLRTRVKSRWRLEGMGGGFNRSCG